jgi:hypothetical protein
MQEMQSHDFSPTSKNSRNHPGFSPTKTMGAVFKGASENLEYDPALDPFQSDTMALANQLIQQLKESGKCKSYLSACTNWFKLQMKLLCSKFIRVNE